MSNIWCCYHRERLADTILNGYALCEECEKKMLKKKAIIMVEDDEYRKDL